MNAPVAHPKPVYVTRKGKSPAVLGFASPSRGRNTKCLNGLTNEGNSIGAGKSTLAHAAPLASGLRL